MDAIGLYRVNKYNWKEQQQIMTLRSQKRTVNRPAAADFATVTRIEKINAYATVLCFLRRF